MASVPLWRVCRVVSNRVRLRMLLALDRQQRLRVGELARAMKISQPTASQYLRALEACGFVRARRIRRAVMYESARSDKPRNRLMEPLMGRLRGGKNSIESVFRLATAFANPGRIEVFRRLKSKPKSLIELKSELEWSRWTLSRHLEKLKSRGFVKAGEQDGTYTCPAVADEFGRALVEAAEREN